MEKLTKDKFIEKAKNIHGDTVIYDKVDYINNKVKVCLICPHHGEFWMSPNNFLMGHKCPSCSGKLKLTTASFVKRANTIHNGKYKYDNVQVVNNDTKVCIICPEHGEFWQTPHSHLNGIGCPKCGIESRSNKRRKSQKQFTNDAKAIFHDSIKYNKVNYVNTNTLVCLVCPKHGEFWMTPHDHLDGHSCPSCGHINSNPESEIISILNGVKIQKRCRSILYRKEIDIYIPSLKLGIEYNGLRWHSEDFGKDRHYHLDKLNECNEKGVSLVQIFEDEWINKREICESKLKQICGLNNELPKIFARKCSIREITNKEVKEFLNRNHIQGFASATVYLGCYTSDNQLVGVMAFKKEKEGYWDLNRFATDINYQCIGVGGKLFKHFTSHYDFIEIKSFADRRWTTNPQDNLYTKLGFEFVEFTRPDYKYYKNGTYERFHKFGFRKQILHKKYGLPLTMTESEMVKELGYTKIWDCGLIKYVYNNKELDT